MDLWGGYVRPRRHVRPMRPGHTAARVQHHEGRDRHRGGDVRAARAAVATTSAVSAHWPEFAAHGKERATVAQLLSHQCGLISVDGPITLAEALDWDDGHRPRRRHGARLADRHRPRLPRPHLRVAGRRVDPSASTAARQGASSPRRSPAPLGLDLWIGLPEELEPRVSPLIGGLTPNGSTTRRCRRSSTR